MMIPDDEPMQNSFKDTFNYIAAFLSVLVGLAAFKDYAEQHSLRIIHWDISILLLTLPFIFSMILATYVGALAMQSRAVNFTWFPLTKILEWIANACALIGLLYPCVVLLAYLSTLAGSYIPNVTFPGGSEAFSSVLSGIIVVAAALLIARVNTNKLKDRYAVNTNEVLAEYYARDATSHAVSGVDILVRYNSLVGLAKSTLRLKGYGVSGDNLSYISKKLSDIGIFSESDIAKAEDVSKVRNSIAHGTIPTKHSIQETGKMINELANILRESLAKN